MFLIRPPTIAQSLICSYHNLVYLVKVTVLSSRPVLACLSVSYPDVSLCLAVSPGLVEARRELLCAELCLQTIHSQQSMWDIARFIACTHTLYTTWWS